MVDHYLFHDISLHLSSWKYDMVIMKPLNFCSRSTSQNSKEYQLLLCCDSHLQKILKKVNFIYVEVCLSPLIGQSGLCPFRISMSLLIEENVVVLWDSFLCMHTQRYMICYKANREDLLPLVCSCPLYRGNKIDCFAVLPSGASSPRNINLTLVSK